ncbi:hypothetical protein [Chitinophaga sp. MD30]|nr:hypothetical protein [Chitinophaga sp. MD30]
MRTIARIPTLLLSLLLLCTFTATAQLVWPAGQLLPSFPATNPTQDLIILRESSSFWEAEGSALSHKTGRLETDGWLCQTGIDAPNEHMIYGPYVNNIPAGPNVAEFRMKIDNNTANDDPVVDIDVRNATTGQILAAKTLTRKQFPVASDYTNFTLPFIIPAND